MYDLQAIIDGYQEFIGEVPVIKQYRKGDLVYCKHTNCLGVVLGLIDHKCQDLRTDCSGMVSFDNIFKVGIAPSTIKYLYHKLNRR